MSNFIIGCQILAVGLEAVMFTFIGSLAILILGYLFYGKYVEKVFGVDDSRQTPAIRMPDGVDYVPLGAFKSLFIQFLNVVGTGPIFGAIAGAAFGPMAFVWITLGCVFGGAVHDYFSGMLSVRQDGATVGEIVGENLGNFAKSVLRILSLVLLVLVAVVFWKSPAQILYNIMGGTVSLNVLLIIILCYYALATVMSIDKIIAKLYPIFGVCLFFMAVGISVALIAGNVAGYYRTPEITEVFKQLNYHKTLDLFPFLFISIACGAISGFHATQSPIIGRCIKKESDGGRVFYLAMIGEGIVATIWAAAAITLFPKDGVLGLTSQLEGLAAAGSAPVVVNKVAAMTLGGIGSILAVLGVVAAPITSGDTAFRGARLVVADILKIDQKSVKNRFIIAIPLFAIGIILAQVDFSIIWRYFAWSNQTLAMFGLWSSSVWLMRRQRNFYITLLPAIFMTLVSVDYIILAPEGFAALLASVAPNVRAIIGIVIAAIVAVVATVAFFNKQAEWTKKKMFIKD